VVVQAENRSADKFGRTINDMIWNWSGI